MTKWSKKLGDNEKRKLWAVYIQNVRKKEYHYKTFEHFCSILVRARNIFKTKP